MSQHQRLAWLWAEGRRVEALVFLAALFAVFLALSLFVHTPRIQRVDEKVTVLLQSLRNDRLDVVARLLTFLGNTETLVGLAFVAAALFLRLHRPWAAVLSAASTLGLPINLAMKQITPRTRPQDGMIHVILPAVGLSFPSGHAMVSVMFYGFLAMMVWIHVPDRGARIAVTTFLAVLPVFIGASRIYLGAHWFSDVIAGWTAGLFFLLVLAGIYKALAVKELAPPASASPMLATVQRDNSI
jgi:undecaprenyl-diphosphatase